MSIDQYLSRILSKTLGEQGIVNPRGANIMYESHRCHTFACPNLINFRRKSH